MGWEREDVEKPFATQLGVGQAVVSPAAILVSENILHGISVYRSNPTRFYVHVFPLFQGYLRPYARLDGKQLFGDTFNART